MVRVPSKLIVFFNIGNKLFQYEHYNNNNSFYTNIPKLDTAIRQSDVDKVQVTAVPTRQQHTHQHVKSCFHQTTSHSPAHRLQYA